MERNCSGTIFLFSFFGELLRHLIPLPIPAAIQEDMVQNVCKEVFGTLASELLEAAGSTKSDDATVAAMRLRPELLEA